MAARNAAGTPLLAVLLLLGANLLIPLAIGIFGKGFFPYKPLLPGLAQYEDHGFGPPAPAPFDRVVFMVVDALRSDFVYVANSGFQFTQSLIRSGAAVPFTAHATSPTVTMPRIKAITTGSIPSFLDVVLNVDEGDKSSSLASQDTWLAQMKAKQTQQADGADAGGKLVLYGDDTWLKLFPDTFDRADGTSSFFVADFTEVDNNVTRHVPRELRQTDWGLMVLHYLGLDHIGHKGGPRSPNMVPKQHEMDAIVREIYEAMETQPHLANTLLVLLGDHGMNDAGNHGASSAGETSPALLFVAPKLKTALADPAASFLPCPLAERDDFQFYHTVEQSDLAPTLGALLGFPAPKNNLGAFIPTFLPLWSRRRDQVQILMHNAHQILRVLEAAFGPEVFAEVSITECNGPQTHVQEIACAWHDIVRTAPRLEDDDESGGLTDASYDEWATKTIKTMSGMASNYNIPMLCLGLGAAACSMVLAIGATYAFVSRGGGSGLGEMTPFALISITYGIMMFASSYVEEEHHFWYWATSAWLAVIGGRSVSLSARRPPKHVVAAVVTVVAAFTAVRLLRGWNQTGQKFAGEPDLVKTILQPNPQLLWTFVAATYALIAIELVQGLVVFPAAVTAPAVFLLVLSALSFKLVFTYEDSPELVASFASTLVELIERIDGGSTGPVTLITRARVVFAGLSVATAAAVYSIVVSKRQGNTINRPATNVLLPLYALLAVTQSRTTNIPLFLLFGVIYRFLAAQQQHLAPTEITTAALLLQFASFFAFGGTNAISSVDLSSAYNGISGFSAGAVGVLIFVSNWAGSIYWAVASVLLLTTRSSSSPPSCPWLQHASLLTVFAAASAVAVMAACTALRTHLFVWTVFSPKYLYCIAWSLGMHLGINLGLGGLLYWLGTSS
ncbi:ethanolaminephosphotransferase [Sporothrix brasiliensis 5110]|uniref:GPI ethanolamine phosphate transferase 2 n=1 Tax=Sporothrix brasiliensis 5110 TaxID=1398154 RepID=A0A0C2FPB8_9PEZI|nr:ethanolaminephosphotransferase [Sporothrix brasiliensis 5110]KIH92918.1 ethanolaminephosphotransferase [Sporothrix brasiliensis 5110]